jgi:hypothetical protein
VAKAATVDEYIAALPSDLRAPAESELTISGG